MQLRGAGAARKIVSRGKAKEGHEMALGEEAIDTLVDEMRAAARSRRDSVRHQIASQYKELVALPKRERLAETKRRIDAAVKYVHSNVPAADEENAAIARQRLRAALQTRFGEVTDGDLDRLTLKARRAVEEDVRAECRQIVHDVRGPASAKKHAARTRIGV
jgi:hypothetical protein